MQRIMHVCLALVIVLVSTVPGLANPDFSCTSVTEIPQIECEALVALYNSTNGPGWTDHSNWLVTSTPSNWYGMTVSDWSRN